MTPFEICLLLWKSAGVLCHVGVALVYEYFSNVYLFVINKLD